MTAPRLCLWAAFTCFALGAIIPLIRGGEPNWLCAGAAFWVLSGLIGPARV